MLFVLLFFFCCDVMFTGLVFASAMTWRSHGVGCQTGDEAQLFHCVVDGNRFLKGPVWPSKTHENWILSRLLQESQQKWLGCSPWRSSFSAWTFEANQRPASSLESQKDARLCKLLPLASSCSAYSDSCDMLWQYHAVRCCFFLYLFELLELRWQCALEPLQKRGIIDSARSFRMWWHRYVKIFAMACCFPWGNMAYAFGLSPPMAAVLGKVHCPVS